MTKAPTSYIEAKNASKAMIEQAERLMDQQTRAIATLISVRDELDRMTMPAPDGYRTLKEFVEAEALANPDQPVWQSLSAEVSLYVSEILALRQRAITLATVVSQ